jgi:transmembrane sensor
MTWAKDEERRTAAADWVVRLQADDLAEAEALAFDAWLSASPTHLRAYDAALATWRAYGADASAIREALEARPPRPALGRFYPAFGAAAAAALAVAVLVPALQPAPKAEAYATARGEHRSVTLADGSKIDLNGATRLSVVLRRHERDVRIEEGEAVFDVAADKARPFLIDAGDRAIRVVGTQFDVRRRAGRLSVTVTRGVVEVSPSGGGSGQAFRLHPGQRFDHAEGAGLARISRAAPEEALGWKAGRLVYHDQPLGQVVADLNAQFATPIRVSDPALAATPISGVLILDDENAVVRRLALLVSAKPVPSDGGVTLER